MLAYYINGCTLTILYTFLHKVARVGFTGVGFPWFTTVN